VIGAVCTFLTRRIAIRRLIRRAGNISGDAKELGLNFTVPPKL
jgi:hypothetical protein